MSHWEPSRRDLFALAFSSLAPMHAAPSAAHLGSGIKIGEITSTSVRIWTRRTRDALRNADGIQPSRTEARALDLGYDLTGLQGACPGDPGQLRILVSTADARRVYASEWAPAIASHDFTRQFLVANLKPSTAYRFTVETRTSGKTDGSLDGAFRTASREDAASPVDLAMLSCQKYSQRDDDNGFHLYDAIRAWHPDFYLSVGDNVYYDSDDPVVNDPAVARHHWHRMFSLPRVLECLRTVPGYWVKDDHDCYSDDCWPGLVTPKMEPFRFEQGLRIYPEQVPIGAEPYRRFRWGRALEIWLLEGRDFRSPNPSPDGPQKSIWGDKQKKWLLASLVSSPAHWKLIISPTPIVGPDRSNKYDNHSNVSFATEGREFRRWLRDNVPAHTFVLCGDRHWQYHSVDPETGVEEFGCGAASDSHASGSPGEDPKVHRFHRVKGGFLAIQVRPDGGRSRLVIAHRDVHGATVNSRSFERAV
jgi:alkaline phosphatase D